MALVRVVALKNFLSTSAPLACSTNAAVTAYSTVGPNAGERLYAGLHLTAASTAATFAMTIQSASSSGFSVKTTEVVFTLSSTPASSWATVAPGAALSTDRPWRRANWTISTSGGTATWNGLVWVGFR